MANSVSHAALPYPIKKARYTILVPYLDADGDPTDPTTPDTERSIDGAAFADCSEETTTITGSNGMGYITITGDELNASIVAVAAKVASGPKNTLATLYPRVLPIIRASTAAAGAAGTITLDGSAVAIDDYYNGCIVRTTGGTGGGGGSGSLNNQARIITDYVGSTKVATIEPNWETNPSSDTTFDILVTEMSWLAYADLRAWVGVAPSALISGRVDANTQAMASAVITAAVIADAAIDNATFAADVGSTAIATNVIGIASKKGTVDALNVDTYAEPGQSAPAATATLVTKIGFLYKAFRNKITQTVTTLSLFNDDAATVDQKSTVTDDGTTYTRGELGSGP
jgi:hypothetical protein